MSAQIRRRNDRSKLVERDYGRRLYATDVSYPEAMRQKTQKYLDSVMLIKHSEFEKPYLEDDYETMQYGPIPPIPPMPPTPPYPPIPDCRVGCEAAGVVEGWQVCAPDDNCSGWVFTCAHKIVKLICHGCKLTLVEYLPGDRLMVIICSDEDRLTIEVLAIDPQSTQKIIKERVCCPTNKACDGKCLGCPAPTIGYTSQQMSCSGTQTLTHSGGGAGGKYTWSADYGTFSTPTGASVVYTAPSANAECAANPTITLTDCCGHTGTLKIAVNCYGVEEGAVRIWTGYYCDEINPTTFNCYLYNYTYLCNGTLAPTFPCKLGRQTDTSCNKCYTTEGAANCSSLATAMNVLVAASPVDLRTSAMKTNGCCPQQLL